MQWRAIVRAQSGTSRSWTSVEQRYSSGCRSKASSSAVVPSSRAASSYQARACPISFWAIEEKATSSSSSGAIPVHSELRQPRISSSSAISSSRCVCSFTGLSQLLLQGVAVDAVVVPLELVDELLDCVHGVAGHHPERGRLAAPAVLLPCIDVGELVVRRLDGAGVLKRLPFPLLPEDLVDHAASATTAPRTNSVPSRVVL